MSNEAKIKEVLDRWAPGQSLTLGEVEFQALHHAFSDIRILSIHIEKLQVRTKKAEAWVSDLQAGMYINCVYCGHRYGPDDEVPAAMADVLKEHIAKCPEHPLSEALARAEKAEAERDSYVNKRWPRLLESLSDRIDAARALVTTARRIVTHDTQTATALLDDLDTALGGAGEVGAMGEVQALAVLREYPDADLSAFDVDGDPDAIAAEEAAKTLQQLKAIGGNDDG